MNGFKISLLLIVLVINIDLISCHKDKTPLKPDDNYTWIPDTSLIPEILSAVDSNRIWDNLIHLTSYPDRANYGRNIEQAANWLYNYMANLGFEVTYHKYLWDQYKLTFSNTDHGIFRNERDNYRTMITTNAGISWQHIEIPDGTIFFLNPQIGFVTQHGNNVKATTDGGLTWETRNDEFGGWKIFFLNENDGWLDDDNMLYVTHNGGYDWQLYANTYHKTTNFFVLDSLHIWIPTYSELMLTTDGGITWAEIEIEPDSDNDIFMFNHTEGVMRAGVQLVMYTTDGGFTWTESTGFNDEYVDKLFGHSVSHSWAVGREHLFYSSDGSKSWSVRSDLNWATSNIYFTDSLNGWYSSTWGLYETEDGGRNWEYQIDNLPVEVTFENIVCTFPGKIHPEKEILLIGHYDTVSGSVGADDNGSGVVALLEIAEILSKYDFNYTIKIVFFSNEEIQQGGSQHYAEEANQRRDDILAVINFDIIGYCGESLPRDLHIDFNPESEWLADSVMIFARKYTSTEVIKNIPTWGAKSDHHSFWDKGFTAIWLAEAESYNEANPYINTIDDILEYVNKTFLVDNIKVGIVSAAAIAEPVVKSKEK